MSEPVSVFLIRALIALAAGETTIRYIAWWRLCQQKGALAATPLVGVVALFSASQFAIYATLLFRQVRWPEVTPDSVFMLIWRAGMVASFCYATYAVTTIVYHHSLRRAVTEMLVRLFHLAFGVTVAIAAMLAYYHHP